MEHPDLWQLDGEMLEKNEGSASELLLHGVWVSLGKDVSECSC